MTKELKKITRDFVKFEKLMEEKKAESEQLSEDIEKTIESAKRELLGLRKHEIDRDNIRTEYKDLQKFTLKTILTHKTTMEQTRGTLNKFTQQYGEIAFELSSLENRVTAKNNEIKHMQGEIRNLEREHQIVSDKAMKMIRQRDRLRDIKHELTVEATVQHERTQFVEKEIRIAMEAMQKEMDRIHTEEAEAAKQVKKLEDEMRVMKLYLDLQMEDAKKEFNKAQALFDDQQQQLARLLLQRRTTADKLHFEDIQLEIAETEVSDANSVMEAEVVEFDNEISAISQEIEREEARVSALEGELIELEKIIEEQSSHLPRLKTNVVDADFQYEMLQVGSERVKRLIYHVVDSIPRDELRLAKLTRAMDIDRTGHQAFCEKRQLIVSRLQHIVEKMTRDNIRWRNEFIGIRDRLITLRAEYVFAHEM